MSPGSKLIYLIGCASIGAATFHFFGWWATSIIFPAVLTWNLICRKIDEVK